MVSADDCKLGKLHVSNSQKHHSAFFLFVNVLPIFFLNEIRE